MTIYWSGRLFRLSPWTAASAAAISPFLASAAGIGYETKAYVWVGYGVWTQLWASWTLPLAWGFTYRALRSLRGWVALPAVLFIMVTVALHYETGYLALGAARRLAVPRAFGPVAPPRTSCDVGRGSAPGVGLGHRAGARAVALGCAEPGVGGHGARERLRREADALVALLGQPLRQQPGPSAPPALWLPVVTILVGIGILVCIWRWRTNIAGRALLTIWVVTLFMSFGRTTFGSLYAIVPGSSDIFIRRFQMGVQLSGILLAGIGVVFLGQVVLAAALAPTP